MVLEENFKIQTDRQTGKWTTTMHSVERVLANRTIENATNLLLGRQALVGTQSVKLDSDDHSAPAR